MDFLSEYEAADSIHEQYILLLREQKRLRRQFHKQHGSEDKDNKTHQSNASYDYNTPSFRALISDLNETLDGHLVVFTANDFGAPIAFYPDTLDDSRLQDIREYILGAKYNHAPDLNEIRQQVRETDERIHRALIAEVTDEGVRLHNPEGRDPDTNFLTIRDYLGLVDWTINYDTIEYNYAQEYLTQDKLD